jgi:hypothetical protein
MQCDPRYDILFEPVRIGPVTAKNRFSWTSYTQEFKHVQKRLRSLLQTALEALTSDWQAAGGRKVKFVFDGAHRNHR